MREKGALDDSSASVLYADDLTSASCSDAAVATATSLIAAEDIHVRAILDPYSVPMPARLSDSHVGRSQSDVRPKQSSMIMPLDTILSMPVADPDASHHERGLDSKLHPTDGKSSGVFDVSEENVGLPGTSTANVGDSKRGSYSADLVLMTYLY